MRLKNQHPQRPRLVLLSPSTSDNLAKNSTASTCLVTAADFLRASTLIKGFTENANQAVSVATLQSIISPLRIPEFIAASFEIIALELVYENEESPSRNLPDDVEAWGCAQYLPLLVGLEKKLDASLLRPFSRALN